MPFALTTGTFNGDFYSLMGMIMIPKLIVLIAEDDREMRSILCDELCSRSYQLRVAQDGDEAFRAVLEAPPDLIVTDFRMPSGGVDYISRLHTIAPQCPIIVMTAFGGEKVRAEVMQAGASAYFEKPVRLSQVKAKVEELLFKLTGS